MNRSPRRSELEFKVDIGELVMDGGADLDARVIASAVGRTLEEVGERTTGAPSGFPGHHIPHMPPSGRDRVGQAVAAAIKGRRA